MTFKQNNIVLLFLQFFGWLGDRNRQYAVLGVVMALASVQGYANLSQQWSVMGEFSNVPQEHLVEWINTNTPSGNNNIIFCVYFMTALVIGNPACLPHYPSGDRYAANNTTVKPAIMATCI